MALLSILAFVALIGAGVYALFLPRTPKDTFTDDEMEAFQHAEQVRIDLAKVQADRPKRPTC
jgi:hypothetical protein